MARAPATSPHVSLHIVENSGLLFDRRQQMLFSANASAAYIWCCLEECVSPTEIVTKLERRFSFDREQARRYFTRIVERWREDGLIEAPIGPDVTPPGAPSCDTSASGATSCRENPSARLRATVTGTYDLLDMRFTLDFADPILFDIMHPLIAHLCARGPMRGRLRLALAREQSGATLFADDTPYASCEAMSEVPPMVLTALSELAVHRSSASYAVQAAAVRLGERCILLPGGAGTGKSTLVATLAAEGFEALADDIVLLSHGVLRPLPLAVGVKPGAWPSLWRNYPGLRSRPTFRLGDGTSVKYVLPGCAPTGRQLVDRIPADAIVFPQYRAQEKATLGGLSRAAALSRLMQSFYLLHHTLDENAVEALIEWVSAAPCYDLRYGSAADTAGLLRGLCR